MTKPMTRKTISNSFLKFFDLITGEEKLILLEHILNGGWPTYDPDQGEDLTLESESLFDCNGNPL